MRKIFIGSLLATLCLSTAGAAVWQLPAKKTLAMQAEEAGRTEDIKVVENMRRFQGKRGVAIQSNANGRQGKNDGILTFELNVQKAGKYVFWVHAGVDEYGKKIGSKARSKYQSFFLQLTVNGSLPTKRVVFEPWRNPEGTNKTLGQFYLTAGKNIIKLQLPRGVILDCLSLAPYKAPKVPAAARKFELIKLPGHPRLMVNSSILDTLRKNLEHKENKYFWNLVRQTALRSYKPQFPKQGEVPHDAVLERAIACKAFYYLINGSKSVGRDAVDLTREYISRVEFGNLLDITREIGAAIYTASLVYDWCYDLMSDDERNVIRRNLIRLAENMECGWPPFKQSILSGHGNEAQINRDLLSMAVAIYDEDPEPVRYCSYCVLQQLVPNRAFDYQSPRHSQGISYSSFRFAWEMYAAWIFKRLLQREVFDSNIKNVAYYWIYMRTPWGFMFRDGDGASWRNNWGSALASLLCYTYAEDPVLKGEFLRTDRGKIDPILFLLLNIPQMTPQMDRSCLPKGLDFGPVRSGMSIRNSWDISKESDAVAAEVRGGGYHYGNHQHSDAGAFQIFFRGQLISPLSIYKFYGTPYDMNFAKRSVAQSMLLVVDPAEKIYASYGNDGGSRFIQNMPRDYRDLTVKSKFYYGKKRYCAFQISAADPKISIYSADLTGAYSSKVKSLTRTFCFIDLDDVKRPALAVVYDRLEKSDPDFKTYWQITTLRDPEKIDNGVRLTSFRRNKGKTGKLDLQMYKPAANDRTMEILTGKDACNVFGKQYVVPSMIPEASGSRVIFSPRKAAAKHEFLALLNIYGSETTPHKVGVEENTDCFAVFSANRAVILPRSSNFYSRRFSFKLPQSSKRMIAVANLTAGMWNVQEKDGKKYQIKVEENNNTLFFESDALEFDLSMQKDITR